MKSLFALSIYFASCGFVVAQQPSPDQLQFFESHIRPALVKYCYQCHSVDEGDGRGGLFLDTRLGWQQGGDSGPAIEPGKPEQSILWEAINWDSYEMPPSKQMPADVIAKFRQWIEMGAPDPRERKLLIHKAKISAKDIEEGRISHWAFIKPRMPTRSGGFQPPQETPGSDKRRQDATTTVTIDSLVTAKLQEVGLKPTQAADAFTILRRINFDLVGLPPTLKENLAFYAAWKKNPEAAYQAKVDELLKRPQYGERWGRHWLDVARYAESSGSRNTPYPHAWRYRNYVIDSFNDNTPYDQFIKEQIAGDLLPAKTDEQWQENLIATGFLAIGLKHHDEKNPRKFLADMVDEQIDTTTQAVLGLTVACARCHDHKYDPIPTADYYALAGIFNSTQTYYGTTRIAQNHRPSELLLLPIADKLAVSRSQSQQAMESLKERIAELDQQMAGVRGKDRRNIRNVRNRVAAQLAALNPDGTPKAFGMGVQEAAEMVNANILISGEVEKPAQEVPRGFVQVLGDLNFTVEGEKSSGRLELVEAMTSKENPLTARVMVNRIWMHLLGKPLVGTPSNFGFSGMKPENQGLLDYLAVRFMDEDWNIKSLIREIVISDTYRRSSQYNEANYAVDPDNKFLWRANARQIDAEALRDAMMAMSGQINLERPLPSSGGVRGGVSEDALASNTHRSVYLPIDRDSVPSALELFDFPDPNVTSAGRSNSIVPTQALYMMNGDFVTAQAQGMATQLAKQYQKPEDQIRYAFAWAYGRPATKEELVASTQFFREFRSTGNTSPANVSVAAQPQRRAKGGKKAGKKGLPPGRNADETAGPTTTSNQALAVFCQTLMASARFRILN